MSRSAKMSLVEKCAFVTGCNVPVWIDKRNEASLITIDKYTYVSLVILVKPATDVVAVMKIAHAPRSS
jgi:hypothetical protein